MLTTRYRPVASSWLLVALCLTHAGAGAAQKIEVKSEKAPNANFTAIRTYAWLPPAPMVRNTAPDGLSNPTLTQEALGPHIVAAIDRELTSRGLQQTTVDVADIRVVYFAALTTGVNQTYLGEYYGYVTGWASPIAIGYTPTTSSTIYEKGTILVDIVDRASNRGIWRGVMSTKVLQERTLAKRIERINEGTARLFKQLPIGKKK
jgi:Domain of unknown function (DUF4136)